MHDGWIKLYRKSIDSGLMKDHKLWTFWTWCLLSASHKDYKIIHGSHEITLKPGQFVMGRREAARELGMSEQNIRTCLGKLIKHGNLTSKSTNRFTILTIVKWGTYQCDCKDTNQQYNQQVTNNQPTGNHIQEWKNGRMEENKHNTREKGTSESSYESSGKKSQSFTIDDEKRVLDYLNTVTGKHYNFRQPIRARLMDGYRVDQLLHVIDIKTRHDPYFMKNPNLIKPETLFGDPGRFDGYLNETPEDFLKSQSRIDENDKLDTDGKLWS